MMPGLLVPPAATAPLTVGGGVGPGPGGGWAARLGGLATNPLVNLGVGMMSASGWRNQPTSFGEALGAGFNQMQRAGLLDSRLTKNRAEVAERKRRLDEQKRAREAKIEAYITRYGGARSAAETLVDSGAVDAYLEPPVAPKSPTLKKVWDPATKTVTWKAAEDAAGMPAPPPTPLITQQFGGGGGLLDRPMTPDELVARGYPPDTKGLVARGGQVAALPQPTLKPGEKKTAEQQAVSIANTKLLTSAGDAYKQAVYTWRTDRTNLDKRAKAKEARAAAVEALAKRDAGNRSPTDDDRRAAEDRIPDFFTFEGLIGSIAGGDPFTARMDQILDPNAEPSATPERVRTYNPATGRLE